MTRGSALGLAEQLGDVELLADLAEQRELGLEVVDVVFLVGKESITKVTATVDLEDGLFSGDANVALPASHVHVEGMFVEASIRNPSAATYHHGWVGAICYGADGKVVGGGQARPTALPGHSSVTVQVPTALSEKPSQCTVIAQPGATG